MLRRLTRRDILKTGALAGFGGVALVGTTLAIRERPAPYRNVLLITCDCLRADRLGCYGYKRSAAGAPQSITAGLDALADEGTLFEHHYSQSDWTPTSLVSLLNSANPVMGSQRSYDFLRDHANIIYELRSFLYEGRSYYSEAILSNVLLLDEVFTQNFERIQNATTVRRFTDKMEELNERIIFPRAEAIRERVESVLDHHSHRDQSFFVWAHFMDTHEPYSPASRFLAQLAAGDPEDCFTELKRAYIAGRQVEDYQAKLSDLNDLYDASLMYADEQLALTVQAVKARHLLEDTLVIITADHGQSLGEHGAVGHGLTLYDPEVRIPLIMLGPGVPRGVRVRTRTWNTDVIPTISEFLGKTNTRSFDGESLFPLASAAASGRMTAHREVFSCADYPDFVMEDRKKEMLISPSGHAFIETVDTEGEVVQTELYDLNRDPGQAENIAASQEQLTATLAARLRDIHATDGRGPHSYAPAATPVRSPEIDAQLRALGYVSG